METLRQRLAREEGFTLIELLVVLLIIAILLSIAIPSYLGIRTKAQQSAAASDVRGAVPDAGVFYADYHTYATISFANLQSYDSGLVAYSSSTPGLKTVKGGATHYCISADDAGWYAHIVAPGGQVVSRESSDYCATWPAS